MSKESKHGRDQSQYATPRHLATRGSFQAKYASVSWFDWLIDKIDLKEGACILDVGCGPGWLWRASRDRLPSDLRVSLVDTSQGMIEEAKTNLAIVKQVEVIEAGIADAVALPYASETFDIVLLLHVLYHVSDPRSAIQEASRVLRSGGQLFVSTNTLDKLNELHVLGAQAFGGPPVDPGAALFSLDDAEKMIGDVFEHTERYDLTDVMACTDPADAVAVLLSMPPGNTAPHEQQNHLSKLINDESERTGGVLRATRRNGLILGIKAI